VDELPCLPHRSLAIDRTRGGRHTGATHTRGVLASRLSSRATPTSELIELQSALAVLHAQPVRGWAGGSSTSMWCA